METTVPVGTTVHRFLIDIMYLWLEPFSSLGAKTRWELQQTSQFFFKENYFIANQVCIKEIFITFLLIE